MTADGQTNPQDPSTSRFRENEETFARANDEIQATAERYHFDQLVPFLCECAEPACLETIRLSIEDYRKARDGGGGFILLPGHDDPHVERVVSRRSGYVLVEKFS